LTVEKLGDTYTAIANTTPSRPGAVVVNGGSAITAGVPFNVTWGASSDDQGAQYISYRVSRGSAASGTWGNYRGTAQGTTTFTDIIAPYEAASVSYSVWPSDSFGPGIWGEYSPDIPVINNSAPAAPAAITVGPLPLQQGGPVTVSWAASTDPDGNLAGYRLEQQVDGGAWAQAYQGASLSWAGTIGSGWNSVAFRVLAYDSYNAISGWRTSSTYSMTTAVVITVAQDSSSGIKNGQTYTTNAARSVVFAISSTADPGMTGRYSTVLRRGGAQIASSSNALISGGKYTYSLTKSAWIELLNGSHTFSLTVTASTGESGTGSIAFTKNISHFTVYSDPIPVEIADGSKLKDFLLNIAGSFPAGSSVSVWATNNALDPAPVWEALAWDQINNENLQSLGNTAIANGNAFAFKVSVSRGAASYCRIDSISGQAGKDQMFILGENTSQLRAALEAEAAARAAADAALAGQIEANRLAAFTYKGDAADFAGLPADPELNDVWKTLDTGDEWYWNGSEWHAFGPAIMLDATPTENSSNPVSSGGVWTAIQALQAQVEELQTLLGDTAQALDPTP
jgi:hypothetical protein